MSSGEVHNLTSVVIDPTTLHSTLQTEVRTSIGVTSNVVIDELYVYVNRPHFGYLMKTQLFLRQGNNPGEGTWSSVLSFPPNIPDGEYSIEYLYVSADGGLRPLDVISSTENQTRNVRLERSTTPDTEPPEIVSYDIQPRVVQVPSNIGSYYILDVSAIIRDNVGTVFVTATGRTSGGVGVAHVNVYTTPSFGGHIPQMYLERRDNNTAQSGRWVGSIHVWTDGIIDEQLRINFYAFDAVGNMTHTRNLSDKNLTVAIERAVSPSTSDTNGAAVTTITFPGPAAIQNITSESGECQVRISVPRRVIINCECPQKSANERE